MPDNVDTQSTTPATVPASTKWATRTVTYSGDAGAMIAPTGLVVFGGSDDAKTVTDVTAAAPLPVVAAATDTLAGAVTETAPATDTASSGLNGRLQRIAQRLTSIIALLPAALGAGGGLKVDGSGTALPVSLASAPSTAVTNAGTFATQATIQAASAGLDITRISVTPTVSTSPAYTAKDAVGGLLTFANAARVSARGGILQGVTVIDNSQQRPSLELVLFNQTFTNSTDNAIFAPSDADLANVVADVALNSWADFSTNSVCSVMGLGLAFKLTGTSLFGQLLTRGTPTFVATTDIIVILHIIQN